MYFMPKQEIMSGSYKRSYKTNKNDLDSKDDDLGIEEDSFKE